MKQFSLGLWLVLLCGWAFFMGCRKDRDTVVGNGVYTSKNKTLTPFTDIHIAGVVDVYLTQTGHENAYVYTDENIHEYVNVSVSDSVLSISNDARNLDSDTIRVYVNIADFNRLTFQGSGRVFTQNTIYETNTHVQHRGTGTVTLSLNIQSLNIGLAGTGNLELSGYSIDTDLNHSGTGNVNAFGLLHETLRVAQSGSGNSRVTANINIKARLEGTGDLVWRGNARAGDMISTGLGTIRHE